MEKPAHILIVDDDPLTLRGITRVLESAGYQVNKAETGQDCLDLITKEKPDLIVLDVNLPDIDGIEVCKRIKTNPEWKSILVIHLSSQRTSIDDQVDGLESGADGYLVYPLNNKELLARIRAFVRLKKAEEERLSLQEELHQSRKMEAIATFAGGIAHEFNNILGAIIGFTELTLNDLSHNSKAQKNLMHTLHASERARNLITQFITFSRQGEFNRQLIDFPQFIEENLASLTIPLGRPIEMKRYLYAKVGKVLANPCRLQQMVNHLHTNACNAMFRQGGVLSITLEDVFLTDEHSPLANGLSPGSYFKLTFADTGPGMEQDVMDHIFEPFFTTQELGTGKGLGLAIVYGIVKGQGGSISVASQPGQGTTFTILLPKREN